jgi:hypothetical protein
MIGYNKTKISDSTSQGTIHPTRGKKAVAMISFDV